MVSSYSPMSIHVSELESNVPRRLQQIYTRFLFPALFFFKGRRRSEGVPKRKDQQWNRQQPHSQHQKSLALNIKEASDPSLGHTSRSCWKLFSSQVCCYWRFSSSSFPRRNIYDLGDNGQQQCVSALSRSLSLSGSGGVMDTHREEEGKMGFPRRGKGVNGKRERTAGERGREQNNNCSSSSDNNNS